MGSCEERTHVFVLLRWQTCANTQTQRCNIATATCPASIDADEAQVPTAAHAWR